MDNFKVQVGNNIKHFRKANHMTLKELAKHVGIAEGTMQKYEAGNITRVDIEMISKIANALNIPPEQLTGWTDDSSTSNTSAMSEETEKALAFYEQYKNAIPQIQTAIESLLKSSQSDP